MYLYFLSKDKLLKALKQKKRLTYKSKKRSVVTQMSECLNQYEGRVKNTTGICSLPYDLIPQLILNLESIFRLSKTNTHFQTYIKNDLMFIIKNRLYTFPVVDKNFITLHTMNIFATLNLNEIEKLFDDYKKLNDLIITISRTRSVDTDRTKRMIEGINYLVSINFIKNIKEFWNYFLDNNFRPPKTHIRSGFLVMIIHYYKTYIDKNYVQPFL